MISLLIDLFDSVHVKSIGDIIFSFFRYHAITSKLKLTFRRGSRRYFFLPEGRLDSGIRALSLHVLFLYSFDLFIKKILGWNIFFIEMIEGGGVELLPFLEPLLLTFIINDGVGVLSRACTVHAWACDTTWIASRAVQSPLCRLVTVTQAIQGGVISTARRNPHTKSFGDSDRWSWVSPDRDRWGSLSTPCSCAYEEEESTCITTTKIKPVIRHGDKEDDLPLWPSSWQLDIQMFQCCTNNDYSD